VIALPQEEAGPQVIDPPQNSGGQKIRHQFLIHGLFVGLKALPVYQGFFDDRGGQLGAADGVVDTLSMA